MKEILNLLISHKTLDKAVAKEVLINMANGVYNQSQISVFLTVYMMRISRCFTGTLCCD